MKFKYMYKRIVSFFFTNAKYYANFNDFALNQREIETFFSKILLHLPTFFKKSAKR